MDRTRPLLPVLVLAALGVILSSVSTPLRAGTGFVRLTWNECDPITQNLNFTGPGQIATLIVSVTGSDHVNRGHRVKVAIRNLAAAGFPDAWRFDDAGCQSG